MISKFLNFRWLAVAALVLTSTACGGGGNSSDTTIPNLPDNGKSQIELEKLATTLNAVDYSKISEGDCGKFALIVQKTNIKFYEWKGTSWLDQSELLGEDYEIDPFAVLSADYTGDEVFEFLVSYNKDGQEGGHEYGGIFMQVDCEWRWAQFIGYSDVSESLDLLSYDKSTKTLSAWGDGPEGRADVILTYDPGTYQFDTQLQEDASSADDSQAKTANQSETCLSLRALYNEGSTTSDPYVFEAAMNDAVYILRSVNWGMIADSIVSFTLQGLWQAALGGIANYLRAYNCA